MNKKEERDKIMIILKEQLDYFSEPPESTYRKATVEHCISVIEHNEELCLKECKEHETTSKLILELYPDVDYDRLCDTSKMLRVTATQIEFDEEYKQNKEMQRYVEKMVKSYFNEDG